MTVSGVVNKDQCIPVITGILHPGNNDSADALTATAYLSDATTLEVRRGGGTTATGTVYVTIVEFTGSNWDVKHGREIDNPADSGTVTLVDDSDGVTAGGGDVGNWSNAMIYGQYSANQLSNIDDSISDTSSSSGPAERATQTTWRPSAARRVAMARPMPREAPVTMATREGAGSDIGAPMGKGGKWNVAAPGAVVGHTGGRAPEINRRSRSRRASGRPGHTPG